MVMARAKIKYWRAAQGMVNVIKHKRTVERIGNEDDSG